MTFLKLSPINATLAGMVTGLSSVYDPGATLTLTPVADVIAPAAAIAALMVRNGALIVPLLLSLPFLATYNWFWLAVILDPGARLP